MLSAERRSKWNTALQKMGGALLKVIPVEDLRDLPSSYGYGLLAVSILGLIAAFATLLVSQYQNNINAVFLSLESSAGKCEPVSRPVDGTYLADTNGYWEGSIDFDYARAIYAVTFSNVNASPESIEELLKTGFDAFRGIGNVAKNQTLAKNMIFWMIYTITAEFGGGFQVMTMAGSPQTLFARRYAKAGLSNEFSMCDVNPFVSYDQANGLLTIRYSYDKYSNSTACSSIALAVHLGYVPYIDGENFVLTIDVRTFVTVVAINSGALDPATLSTIPNTEGQYVVDGVPYQYSQYYFAAYPGMQSFFCQRNNEVVAEFNGTWICTIPIGEYMTLPVFNHAGTSYSDPTPCNCEEQRIKKDRPCNTFNFLAGLMFYEFTEEETIESDTYGYANIVRFANNNPYALRTMAEDAFNATFDTVVRTNQYSRDANWRKNAYEFCTNTTSRGCSFLTILSSESQKYAVTDYYYQVPFGACNDTMSLSDEAIERLSTVLPSSSVEPYFECRATEMDALYSAFGVTVGNILLLRLALMLFLMSFLIFQRLYLRWAGAPETFTTFERHQVLQFFAFQLLLARDGRFKTANKEGESVPASADNSLVVQLQDELGRIPETDRFFDADDKETLAEQSNPVHPVNGEIDIPRKSSNNLEIGALNFDNPSSGRTKTQRSASGSKVRSASSTSARLTRRVYKESLVNPLSPAMKAQAAAARK
jgi:hypothetical protein